MSNGNPAVDLVVVIDTSQSMADEAVDLSEAADAAVAQAMQSCPSDLRVVWLGIELEDPWPAGTRFSDLVRQYLQGDPAVPALDYAGDPLAVPDSQIRGRTTADAGHDAKEDGAAAVVDLCNHFDWRTGAVRAMFLLGDEPLHGGLPQDDDDVAAVDDAISAALGHGVRIFTYLGSASGWGGTADPAEYARLATTTGGASFEAPADSLGGFATLLTDILCASTEGETDTSGRCCGGTVMVNCGTGSVSLGSPCCGAGSPGEDRAPSDEGGVTSPADPDAPVFCPTLRVRIDRVSVARSESYFLGGEGGSGGLVAEWELDISVKGHSQRWSADVEDDTTYDLGWDFVVELADEASSYHIRASGIEKDFITPDDPLPSAEKLFSSGNGWGVGTSGEVSASNADFDYTIHYSVSCLGEPAPSAMSRSAATAAVRRRLVKAGVKGELDEGALLTVFIEKLAGRGLRLRTIDAEHLVFDGHDSVQSVVRRVFP